MGASLVYLDRPNTKKETAAGVQQAGGSQIGYKWACSAMQGWRLNMVNNYLILFTQNFLFDYVYWIISFIISPSLLILGRCPPYGTHFRWRNRPVCRVRWARRAWGGQVLRMILHGQTNGTTRISIPERFRESPDQNLPWLRWNDNDTARHGGNDSHI